jgi:membrane protease subunit (stomatin/prohibitin family)
MIRSVSVWEAFDVISGHIVVKETIDALNERLAYYGIVVDSMAIESVRIPDEFVNILSKTTQWNVYTKFENRSYEFSLLKIQNQAEQAMESVRAKNSMYIVHITQFSYYCC